MVAAQNDKTTGEKEGYNAGLTAGQYGDVNDSSSDGTAAYQEGYKAGYDRGYKEGYAQFESKKETANKEGYELGKNQDEIEIPHQYLSINALKAMFEEGFNKAVSERDEVKKKEYYRIGLKDGETDALNEPKDIKDIYIDAYKKGYDEGQEKLRKSYFDQGYESAFIMIDYKEPSFEVEKYNQWYKEGFDSNKEVQEIQNEALKLGQSGEPYNLPTEYAKAEEVFGYYYEKGLGI